MARAGGASCSGMAAIVCVLVMAAGVPAPATGLVVGRALLLRAEGTQAHVRRLHAGRRLSVVTSICPCTGMLAMQLSGGGTELAKEEKKTPLQERLELLALIALWYATSVVCTNTTKSIGVHWSVLTFSQLVFSTLCGALVVCGFGYKKFQPIATVDQLQNTALLAAVFTMGFVTLNWALGIMHVSLVMTLRATEPMFTLLLASVLLRAERVTWKMGAALLPVIAGAALSSAESADVTFIGLAVVVVCNVCFALRGIVTKRIKTAYPVDEFNLFLQISAIGAAAYGLVLFSANIMCPTFAPHLVGLVDVSQLLHASRAGAVMLNGITFYAYLQLSWVVLARIPAVTHSVCNSMRRPVMCVAGWVTPPHTPLFGRIAQVFQ